MLYDPTTDVGKVRLLLNDTDDTDFVFTNDEIQAFLDLEGDSVKLAAAQAIETNASNEALASKVLSDRDKSTDGAKLADALRKHAQALRDQVASLSEDDDYFEIVDYEPYPPGRGELAEWPG